MKKILSLLVLALVSVQFSFAKDVITKDMNQLPLQAILSIVILQNHRLPISKLIRT